MPEKTVQDHYQKALRFAGERHADQKMPDSEASYLLHLSNVAMEVIIASRHSPGFDLAFAVSVALLHDVLEDTDTDLKELTTEFGHEVAQAVSALTKNENLPAEEQIPDSLDRIRRMPNEVWAVKLADRISNMQAPPPSWDAHKKLNYHRVAKNILKSLQGGNPYLEQRLAEKIDQYHQYLAP